MFIFFSAWFASFLFSDSFKDKSYVLLSEVYGLVALVGGLFGLAISRSLGGFKSYFGKAVILMSIGLLLQEFGQLAYSYMNSIAHVDVPYPSIPDIGFFGSIPIYILGAYYLAKGLGVWAIIKKAPLKLVASIVLSVAIVVTSYWLFLKGYEAAGTSKTVVFFDFGYPLGQAIYVSIAIIILLSVQGLLGGLMKKPVMLLLFAFLVQYAADTNFLYQTIHETWGPAGYGDYIYMLAYFLMALAVIAICAPINSIRQGTTSKSKAVPAEEKTGETDSDTGGET
jgi:hypothetical protein